MADNVVALAYEDATGRDLEGGIAAALRQRTHVDVGGDFVYRALIGALRGEPATGYVSSYDLGVAMKERAARNEAAVRGASQPEPTEAERDQAAMRCRRERGLAILAGLPPVERAFAAGA